MRLSFVIPIYNVGKYLIRTLDSLIKQDTKDFEIIIVDDGSTDDSCEVAERLLSESKLTNYRIIKKKNGGVSSARNKGLSEANGEYVIFLDGDDYVAANFTNCLYKALDEHNYPEIICWGYDKVQEDGSVVWSYFNQNHIEKRSMSGPDVLNKIIFEKNMSIWTGSIAYRTNHLIENGISFTESCTSGEDLEFIYKAVSGADRVIFINEILSFYLQREGSITNSYSIKRFQVIGAMERTVAYLRSNDSSILQRVIDEIQSGVIIEHFLFQYYSCFVFLNANKGMSIGGSLRFLDNDLEKSFPGLLDNVKMIMKSCKGKDKKLAFGVKVFLISPYIYCFLLNIKGKAKSV